MVGATFTILLSLLKFLLTVTFVASWRFHIWYLSVYVCMCVLVLFTVYSLQFMVHYDILTVHL
ncbi:hypothetical protein F5050DRAFT_1793489 [Lentinula boryana]|uniref:Uncharacterized protein n=1 Tax=Lentinula boryana TaxID=40481 RepID=A0ABQ8Q143_9AGAR|nr:hypothetical protein F5050DRAFT_1793489 [Lentinula boryana]